MQMESRFVACICIGDANGKMMLAHAASAQGISVIEQISGKNNVLNYLSIPAACFTHPEISMVGLIEAREKAAKKKFEVSVAKTSFKANTKALAENEGEGLAKLIFRPDNGEILGVHIFGLHALDLIHEGSNAIALGTRIQDIKFSVHAHPTLSVVLDELFKSAKVSRQSCYSWEKLSAKAMGCLHSDPSGRSQDPNKNAAHFIQALS